MAEPCHGYKDLIHSYEKQLDGLLEQGIYKPVFLYHVLLFNVLPLIGLVLPPGKGGQYARKGLFGLCIAIAIQAFRNHRALVGGNGYMLGLMTAWWLIWNATLFVFSNLEHDFKRIERKTAGLQLQDGAQETCDCKDTFIWQSYPEKFGHRLDWSAGLLFNLRGPEWNWRAPHLGPLPQSVHTQLHSGFSCAKFKAQDDATYISGKERFQAAFRTFLKYYLVLDFLKVFMMRDPYFQGVASVDSPPPFPFSYLTIHPFLVQFYRLFFSSFGVFVALEFVTALSPMFFLGLALAFPNAARKLTAAPLGAPWVYANTFGPFLAPILDHGLAGCWGRWWHQLFRFGFAATARWILSLLPVKLSSHSQVRRVTFIVVAFSVSGFVHACGSFTQFTETKPVSGPFLFFSLQIVGILGEQLFKRSIYPILPLSGTPRWLRRTANFVFVFCWLFYSGFLVADDFARGGLWLVEPVPFSLLRGLGIGLQGHGWWCWTEPWFRYWSDGTYWGSGIRVI
ncbi:hypothetical protein N7522_013707 [Penicillium canescens]|uniref:Wax synthase domain-containing protein n=1 Tax=Penicillium canescens TaxID=5083 RepID=A0AAD6I7I0_PENCN|nr:uncharacterized protein N7446_009246 [Penicillium canescens]KAJ5981286.1 hypothetical protein N7522_013707 [Penicillium canescens]KAJ6034496.1 hypothetical protein N7460_008671 [Penicillium canescens]KAJ6046156.1 hypothetical protein N7444_007410 [Penicillium canescens]KAJ6053234.1 hypothetical protein N7446_009246 [Penicillium canescens]